MARCLLLQSGLPKYMWTYALATSGYIRNRCYVQRTRSTPYELFTGKRPNLKNMVPFGTKCFVYVEIHKRKLDDRSQKGVFVGYDRESPAYLVYDRSTCVVRKSRNVKFDTISALCDPVGVDNYVNCDQDNNDYDKDSESDESEDNGEQLEETKERPKRVVKLPKYLTDNYVMNNKEVDDNDDSIYMNIDYCYKMYANVPKSYGEAIASPHALEWQNAMKDEIDSLYDNDTWSVVTLPEGKSVVGGKWVFNIKLDKSNNITKYKARYVARGFSQVSGIDYYDTFAPTARLTTIRVLMQCIVQYDLIIHQMDVKTAYLHADIDCDIYLEQPAGFEIPGNKVCHLKKSLYGLKQSSRNWNNVLNDFLTINNYRRSEVDYCLYIKKCESFIIYVLVWVDDIIIAASNMKLINETKGLLSGRFKMVDIGPLSWFLGIDFKIEKDCISMSQSTYLNNVLTRFKMQDCKPISTPCDKFIVDENSEPCSSTEYRRAVGSLIYAMICTRPDLSWIVTKLSQYSNNPTICHWTAIKRVFRYIKHIIDYCLCFRKSPCGLKLTGYCDSDWGSSIDPEGARRSTTGYCFNLNKIGGAISWKSRRQPTVALSSTEAEYMGLSAATQEALYLKQLLNNIDPQFKIKIPIVVYEDNQGAIALIENPVHHQRTKHIDIRYHLIREQVINDCIDVEYLQTDLMVADCLTKPVGRIKLEYCIGTMFCMKHE